MKTEEKLKILVLFILLACIVPILIYIWSSNNFYPLNLDSGIRIGFLGSFWGSIIGGGCTCWAVLMQKKYADEQRQIDDIANIRPYIVAINPQKIKKDNTSGLKFTIQNIGLNSACGIETYAINLDKANSKEIIERGKYCLTVGASVDVNIWFDFTQTIIYEFHYTDLKENLYYQEFRYDESYNSFIPMEPKKIKNLHQSFK